MNPGQPLHRSVEPIAITLIALGIWLVARGRVCTGQRRAAMSASPELRFGIATADRPLLPDTVTVLHGSLCHGVPQQPVGSGSAWRGKTGAPGLEYRAKVGAPGNSSRSIYQVDNPGNKRVCHYLDRNLGWAQARRYFCPGFTAIVGAID